MKTAQGSSRFLRFTVGAATLVSSLGAISVISPTAAHATFGCDRSNINCTDPNTATSFTGYRVCASGASTPRTTFVPGAGTLELRYSPNCRTVWGRLPANAWVNTDGFYTETMRSLPASSTSEASTQGMPVGPWVSGSYRWTAQLNDAGLRGFAAATNGSQLYWTDSY